MSIKNFYLAIILAVCTFISSSMPAFAVDAIGHIEDFEKVTGEGQYINPVYEDGYILDIEKTGLLESGDKFLNSIANMLFFIVRTGGRFAVSVFYFAMDFDIAKLFATQIDGIQKTLKNTIFDSFFILALAGAMMLIVKKLAKRNMAGVMVDGIKIIFVVALSAFIVTNSATTLSATTAITKEIGVSVLMAVNNKEVANVKSYAADTSGILWKTLVHDVWVSMEFSGTTPSENEVKQFLSAGKNDDARENLVSQYQASHSGTFNKNSGVERIGFIFIYLIPFFVKMGMFILMSGMQLAFQVMALLYVFLAPIVLLLALIPGFGEITVITEWFKKFISTQISIVMVTFVMGMVIMLDTMLYSLTGALGWFPVMIIETLITVILFINRGKIFEGMKEITAKSKGFIHSLPQMGALGDYNTNLAKKRIEQQKPETDKTLSLKFNRDEKKQKNHMEVTYTKRNGSNLSDSREEFQRPVTYQKRYYRNTSKPPDKEENQEIAATTIGSSTTLAQSNSKYTPTQEKDFVATARPTATPTHSGAFSEERPLANTAERPIQKTSTQSYAQTVTDSTVKQNSSVFPSAHKQRPQTTAKSDTLPNASFVVSKNANTKTSTQTRPNTAE